LGQLPYRSIADAIIPGFLLGIRVQIMVYWSGRYRFLIYGRQNTFLE
jgi:hypothetical protein